jgi:hypothetical protein
MKTLARLVVYLSAMFVVYIAALLALRPWHTRWGATDEEVGKPLPGDEFAKHGFSAIHAITIHAPRAVVWEWLVQIGQDRAGFDSFTVFENVFRAEMHNAGTINPAWQDLRAGDYVRLASKKNYGDIPLRRVTAIEKDHYLVLDRWGAFVLEEIDPQTTRFIVRSHEGDPIGGHVLNFLFWEPAHFIMECRMLHGIKRRAEHTA